MTQRKKILFIRPPNLLWPIINESDNFLLPLGFPCLAAYLQERIPELDIQIQDCLPDGQGIKPRRHQNRRRLHRWFLISRMRVILLDLWRSILQKKSFDGFAAPANSGNPRGTTPDPFLAHRLSQDITGRPLFF